MEIIYYLADIITNHLEISAPAAKGLIKLSINDELGPFRDPRRIKYNDFCKVIGNSLKNRLVILGISNPEIMIQNLLK